MAERDHPRCDAEGDPPEPRREEPPRQVRNREPRHEQRQCIRGVAAGRDVVVVRELADCRERDDRDSSGDQERPQKNLRAPRKSLVLIGTTRTSLREFGDSIINPPPSAIET